MQENVPITTSTAFQWHVGLDWLVVSGNKWKQDIYWWIGIFCFTSSKMQFLILLLVPFSNKNQALLSHFNGDTTNTSLGTCDRHLLGPPPKINMPVPLLTVMTQLISCLFRDGRLFSSSQCVNKHMSCACQVVSSQFSRLCFTSSQWHFKYKKTEGITIDFYFDQRIWSRSLTEN